MKKWLWLFILGASLVPAAADWSRAADGAAGTLSVIIAPGPNYIHHHRLLGVWGLEKTPSMAVWLEHLDGRHAATLRVTYRFASQDWIGEFFTDIHRPECLPIWRGAHQVQGVQPESLCLSCHRVQDEGLDMKDFPEVDAVSGATPPDGLAAAFTLPPGLVPGPYRVRAELNHSWDYNESYPDGLAESDPVFSAQGGQPSILWEGVLILGDEPSAVELQPAGRGEPGGRDSLVHPGLDGLTTARAIAGSIKASFSPAPRP
ncbi:MAG: hypothetical protein V1816_20180 [Pseudomonadota bacterium]